MERTRYQHPGARPPIPPATKASPAVRQSIDEQAKTSRICVRAGSHLTNLFQAIEQGDILADIGLVVSDVEGSGAAQFAEAKGIPLLLVSAEHASSAIARNQRILEALTLHAIDWVLCLGYLKK